MWPHPVGLAQIGEEEARWGAAGPWFDLALAGLGGVGPDRGKEAGHRSAPVNAGEQRRWLRAFLSCSMQDAGEAGDGAKTGEGSGEDRPEGTGTAGSS